MTDVSLNRICPDKQKTVLLSGNTAFKIANFRSGLISKLIQSGHTVAVLAPEDDYSEDLIRLGCKFIPLKMTRSGINPLSEIFLILTIARKMRAIRPDIVFSFTIKNNIYCGIASRFLNIPFVPNITGLGPAFSSKKVIRSLATKLYRIALSRADVVFFQNRVDQSIFLTEKIVEPERCRVLPGSGVNVEAFSQVAERSHDQNSTTFLLVARLLWQKGIGTYANAARIVKKQFKNVRFQIVGPYDPDSRNAVSRESIAAWEEEGIIEYLGSTKDVRSFLRGADCMVLPTYYKEGTPRALLEAGASRLPIITTNMPGCQDVVMDGYNGFLVEPRDVDLLVDACRKFHLLDFERKIEMGNASFRHIRDNFAEDTVIGAYLEALDEI